MRVFLLACVLLVHCLNANAASTAYIAASATNQKSSTQESKQLSRYRLVKIGTIVYWVDEKTGIICFHSGVATRGFECVNPQREAAVGH